MAKPPEAPTDNITFNQFSGLKNTVTRERLQPGELERAQNVDIDDMGQLRRRRGYTLKSSGSYHSLFRADHGLVFGVKNGNLGRINLDYSFLTIASNVGNNPLTYVHVNDNIYFSSISTSGKFDHITNVPSPWGAVSAQNMWLSPVVNPVEGLPPVAGELLVKPPLATIMAYFNGRIYLAVGNTLWATELYLYDWVNATKGYKMFENNITVLSPVSDGLYVGTETAVWYLTGSNFAEMRRVQVATYGAIRGSAQVVPANLIPDQLSQSTKGGTLIMTKQGLCIGMDGGQFVNLMQTKVIFPDVLNSNSLFRMQDGANHYVCVADSGGTPASNTRIGDYVDAEIRRFQGA